MLNYQQPDARGHFGPYGGTFVAETLIHALDELKAAYDEALRDPAFMAEFRHELAHFVGRPSPVYHAARLSREIGGAQIHLKREDLNHTGAHKVNNTIGQALLARRMGKPRVIAETGAGQHGVATATICARYGMECVVYMGSEDVKRQSPNVYRMHLLGARVVPVESGSKTLKDALNEALRDWVTNVEHTFYIIGTVAGPHPYPAMVRDFQSVIGQECLTQMPAQIGRQPDAVIACVGGGSNAMGIFHPYIPHEGTRLIGVEAAGEGLDSGRHSASLTRGSPGVLHGNRTYLLQDDNGQITETHSISAGLDYPGVGPEHAYLKDIGRAEYVGITDAEALSAFHRLCRTEGIIPALESSHAVAYAMQLAATMRPDQHLLVNLSGRGDKDIGTVADLSGADFYCRPSCRGQAVKGGIPTVAVRLREGAGPRSEVKEEHRARPDAGDMSGGGQPPRAAAPTALQEPAK
jgi:tryptophan synthase beta chain